MLFEEAHQLLESGYSALETGCFALPNGQMHVAVLTRLPGWQPWMVARWFRNLDGPANFKAWAPCFHLSFLWDEPRTRGMLAGSGATARLKLGCGDLSMKVRFHDPREFLKAPALDNTDDHAAVCANVYDLDHNPLGRFVHLARRTNFGCEVRSRYWLFRTSLSEAMGVMEYGVEVMGRLAEVLPEET